jgi:ferredoxin
VRRVSGTVAGGISREEYRARHWSTPHRRCARKGALVKAIVDVGLCIGCELCVDTCPEVFAMGDDGYSHVIADPIPNDEYDCVREAADICPVEAISTTAD